MIAAFLKNADVHFDYPVALFSLFFCFCIAGIGLALYRAFHTGRILFSWTPRTAKSTEFYVERERNPAGFWFLAMLYSFCILLFVTLIVVMCFGLLRKTA
jgi:hypothetical protein